jgi:hypothetical protein
MASSDRREAMSLISRDSMALIMVLTLSGGLLASPDAWAQDKHKYVFKAPPGVTKYTQQHAIDVGDVPGHQLRVYELYTKYTGEAPVYDGVKVAEAGGRGSSDYTDGSGRSTIYVINLLENGDRIFSTTEVLLHTFVSPDGSRQSRYSTVGTLTGGTGRFKGIGGTIRGTGLTDFKTGTSDAQSEGEYWIEK